MPSESWMNSTNWLQDSLGGLLPQSYEKPWDLVQLSDVVWEMATPVRASFHATVNSPGEQISFLWLEGDDETALKKFAGCIMITLMPKEGLDEAVQTLKDTLSFYAYRPLAKALPPGTEQRVMGRMLGPKKRPDLLIGE